MVPQVLLLMMNAYLGGYQILGFRSSQLGSLASSAATASEELVLEGHFMKMMSLCVGEYFSKA